MCNSPKTLIMEDNNTYQSEQAENIRIGSGEDSSQRAIGDTIAMTLAAITYCSVKDNVQNTLQKYLPGWTLVWTPAATIDGNYAFVASNGVQDVVAIRGSILNFSVTAFDNWFKDDFNIFIQTPWTFPAELGKNPMISQGAMDGLNSLSSLVDSNGFTIKDYVLNNTIKNNRLLCVTGHSLGANLATVFAPWLLYQINLSKLPVPALFSVLTFAAPTSWNKDFADQFDSSFTNTWRYYNELDIVPFCANKVAGLGNLFPPPGVNAKNVDTGSKTLADDFNSIAQLITDSEILWNSYYSNVNTKRGSVPLNTGHKIFSVSSSDPLIAWFEQAGNQHESNHYLEWLGAKPITCQT